MARSTGDIIGSGGANRLNGTAGDDRLFGKGGADTLLGRAGDDILNGGTGADVLNGGTGLDWAVYWDSQVGVVADLQDPSANTGEARGDSYIDIETLNGSQFADILRGDAGANDLIGEGGDDQLEGRDGDDRLFGQLGDDTLIGGAGNDRLNGGAGADLLDGGSGDNGQAVYWDAAEKVVADLQTPSSNRGEALGDRYVGIEGLWGSRFNDVLRGDGGANDLGGEDGNDRLEGRGGDDTLFGKLGKDTLIGGGNDRLNGGAGADLLNGGAGDNDQAVYWDATAKVVADLQDPSSNAGEARGDRYVGIEGIWGSRFDDVLRGDAGANDLGGGNGNDRLDGRDGDDRLFGKAGNDRLGGGAGDDDLNGGAGADRLDGGAGDRDKAVYWDATQGVRVDLQAPGKNTGEAKGDSYLRIEGIGGSHFDDRLYGNGGANRLFGDAGGDRLFGRGGDDILGGDTGNDVLTGNAGADAFLFYAALAPENADIIADFSLGEDMIYLRQTIFDGLATGALAAAHFVSGAAAVADVPTILYDASSGGISYDSDGTGSADALLFASVTAGLALTEASFAVYA